MATTSTDGGTFVPIEIRVRQAAEKRGIASSYQLQNRLGVKPAVAVRLWRNEVKRFDLETMETVCEKLGCEPAEFIVFVKRPKQGSR